MDDKTLINDVASHQSLLVSHEAKLKKIEAIIIDVDQSYKSLVDEVADIQNKLGTLKNVSSDLSSLKNSFECCVKSLKEVNNDLSKRIEKNDSKIVSIEKSISNDRGELEGVLGEYKQCILDQNREGIRLSKKINEQGNEVVVALKDFDKSIKEWTEKKILEMLPKDNSSYFETLKSDLLKKLEVVGIDCMNAVLKAGNISNQIPMLEKRIENISLILKKYELNQ